MLPALAIPAAIGAAESVVGLINSGKTKREAERLKALRPKVQASPYTADQLSLAESELANGMSGGTERAYEEGLSRDVSSSLDTILKGGGDVNNVADIFDRSATGRQRLSLMKENLRLSQINNLVNAQTAAENERLQRFQFNEVAPWMDAAQANSQARQGANNMIWGGLQTLGSAAAGYAEGQETKADMNNYFQTQQRGAANPYLQSSTVQRAPINYGTVQSPGANLNYINPNYANPGFVPSSTIDDRLFNVGTFE
jgi:hypothetical protein